MRVRYQDLIQVVVDLTRSAGAQGKQTLDFAEALVWADAIGRDTHGLWRLPAYLRRLTQGVLSCPADLRLEAPQRGSVLALDGGNGFGQSVGCEAVRLGVERVRETGVAVVTVRNSNHFGVGAYFSHLAAQEGCVSIVMSNSLARVTPPGGRRAVFGTNPLAFGCPTPEGPVLFDTATSAIAGAQALLAAARNERLPKGVAVDAAGSPMTDPHALKDAALLPFAGHKGFGFALMVELFSSVLAGAVPSTGVRSMFNDLSGPSGIGHCFILLDVDAFPVANDYAQAMVQLLDSIRASGDPGEVRIPGEVRLAELARSKREGVALSDNAVAGLKGAFELLERSYDEWLDGLREAGAITTVT